MKVNILGVNVDRVGFEGALEVALKLAGGKRHYITTVNSEFIMEARKDKIFRQILNSADLAIPDSSGVVWASQILGRPVDGRVTGVDLLEKLCEKASKTRMKIGLLGARVGVAERVKSELLDRYGNPKIVFAFAGNPRESADKKMRAKIAKVGRVDILFVAYGAPKQEKWLARNLRYLNVGVAIGVGGAFDYIAGVYPRAPLFVQMLGLEWSFRLATQPWRARRMLSLPQFGLLVWLQKFGLIKT